ncbi:MAG: AAA family ATPase [Candidatus Aenigmarchaeota archaeon]|nr:AAA family ATPase [Candidatus Aenigmarchaeota archaeon]
MLLEKYEPKNLSEMISNKKQLEEIVFWIKNWTKGKALLLHGPTGSGKSILVRLIAKQLSLELVEYSLCEQPLLAIKEDILKTSKQKSLFFKGKLILIDELELISSAKGIIELIKKSEQPLILIAINPYERNLAELRKNCRLVKFSKIRTDSIANFLVNVCKKEGIEYDEGAISQIARMSNGDLRAALIDMEILKTKITTEAVSSLGYREHEESIFNTLKVIFRAMDLNNINIALMNSDKTPEEIMLWLEENIPLEYNDPEEIATAYDYLSKADILASRTIKRQAFSLQKYYSLAAQGVALSKKKLPTKYVLYNAPRIFYAKRKEVPEKLAKALHVSKRDVDMQLIKLLAEKNPELLQKLGLDEDEKEMLA